MPDIEALIQYIAERRARENGCSGYTFIRELPPNIRDTFFALSCLKMLKADSPDREIACFISSYDYFDLGGAYYAVMCLDLIGANVDIQEGMLKWCYGGDEQATPCTFPSTPLISYFKYDLYGMYGSSIFSSPLSAILKRIELGEPELDQGLINTLIALLKTSSQQDLMITYMVLEILRAIERRGCPVSISSSNTKLIRAFLKRCTTRKGYVANPSASSVTLESTYAGHMVAQYLGIPDPLGIRSFIDSLQNSNGGFRRTSFGGISTLESCYLAMSIIADITTLREENQPTTIEV